MVCGLARALPKDAKTGWRGFEGCAKTTYPTFIGTSEIHMQGQMRKGGDVLKMAVRAVELPRACDSVEFSPMDAARKTRAFHDVIRRHCRRSDDH